MIKIFWSDEDKSFVAVDEDRPGCCALDPSEQGALRELLDARDAWDRARAAADSAPPHPKRTTRETI